MNTHFGHNERYPKFAYDLLYHSITFLSSGSFMTFGRQINILPLAQEKYINQKIIGKFTGGNAQIMTVQTAEHSRQIKTPASPII